ncbi:MAG: prolyl oligopeptidase family serine peptidase, partial [Acidobacteriota bacterium]
VRRLTGGPWQVEAVYGLDAAKTQVFFQATEKDPRERHVYRVKLDGTGLTRISKEAGTHRALLAPGGDYWIGTFSSISTPPRIELLRGDGERVRTLSAGTIPALDRYELGPIELGTLHTDDGETLYTSLIKPPDFDPSKKYPVLVYVYGGPRAQMVRNRWGGRRSLFFHYLAQQGLVVFWLDNRGSWGRGKAFEAVIHRKLGEWELKDQVTGVEYLKGQPWVDGERIGVYGGSYGGYMALTCMLKAPEHFKVGIAYAPVTDWRFYDTIYTERDMDTPRDNPEGYRRSAPLHFASGLRGKLLLFHGTMDNNVHLQNTVQMIEELVKAGKQFELMLYPRVRHGIRTSRFKLHFHKQKAEFLVRNLARAGFRATKPQ